MGFMLAHYEVDDYDTWKREIFDPDPAGRKQAAKNHEISRGVDDSRQVFIRLEFDSPEEATSFRERLLASGALEWEGMTVKTPPTVVDVADAAEY
jgi:hypothetical protein